MFRILKIDTGLNIRQHHTYLACVRFLKLIQSDSQLRTEEHEELSSLFLDGTTLVKNRCDEDEAKKTGTERSLARPKVVR